MTQELLLEVFDLIQEEKIVSLHTGDKEIFRFERRAFCIASWLIDDKGELDLDRLTKLLHAIRTFPYPLTSSPELEITFGNKLIKTLQKLLDTPSLWRRIKMFSLPLCHRSAEKLVMQVVKENRLTNALLRRAVLSSCFIVLRQNIGSCFATAPAILIHEEQIESYLDDLYSLLSQGVLKRTYGGIQYIASLSLYEEADMHPLVKSWEFTLASFSEKQHEFVKWNMHVSLGLDPEVQGGLGRVIYNRLEEMLEEANGKVDMYQKECSLAWDKLRSLEGLSRHAQTESEVRRLQAEYQSQAYHLRSCQEMRDEAHALADQYSHFFSFLINHYTSRFTEEFQEVYDPKIQKETFQLYEDRPAGFRLIYKHGRKDPIAWSFLYSAKDYVHCLENFFKTEEITLLHTCTWSGAHSCIEKITTSIVHALSEPIFIDLALERIRQAHKKLFNEGGVSTPWSYISGGTMDTLLNVYYKKEGAFTEENAFIDGVMDLITFIVESVKHLSPNEMHPFIKNRDKRMLMCCVGHAFSFLPAWDPWLIAWQEQNFTYTWARDHLIQPRQKYYMEMELTYDEQVLMVKKFYAEKFLDVIDGLSHSTKSPMEFRSYIEKFDPMRIFSFDAFLYSALPLYGEKTAYEEVWDRYQKYVHNHAPFASEDVYGEIVKGVYPFPPLIFADTNWAHYYFAFVLNPGTCVMELWRVSRLGLVGSPMDTWNQYMNGDKNSLWKIYTRYTEYSESERQYRPKHLHLQ